MATATITGTKASSGPKKTIQKIPVQFWEYGGVTTLCGKQNTIPDYIFGSLKISTAGQLPVKGNDAPVLVKDKWIYIFKKNSDQQFSISYEVKAEVDNNQQKYKIVSWTKADAQKWATTYPRTCLSKTYGTFALDNDIDYYIFLSRIQLPIKRLNDISNHANKKIVNRALRLPAQSSDDTQSVYPLYLLDYLSIADSLRDNCVKSINNFENYVNDADKANLRFLTEMIHSLAQVKPDLKDWLDFSASEKERTNLNNIFTSLKSNKVNGIGRLTAFLSSSGYKETLDDYCGTKDLEETIFKKYASHLQLMDTDPKGLEYLKETMADEESWLSRYFTAEEPFQFYRKIVTLAASDEFAEFLSKYILGKALTLIPPKVKITVETLITIQEKIIVEYGAILTKANIVIPELAQKNGKYFWVAQDKYTRTVSIKYELTASAQVQVTKSNDFSARDAARKKWEGGIDSASLQCKRILLVIEVINLYTSFNKMIQSKGASEKVDNSINMVGSIMDGIGAAKYLLEKTAIQKFGEEVTMKFFAKVTIIGSVCDYAGAVKSTYQSSGEKNYGLAAAYSTIALSAVAAAASGAAAIGGTTVFALSAATLGLIGVALFVVGTALVWAFTEEDLEKWAKKSRFGRRYEPSYSLQAQIHDLQVILCKFSIECYLYAQGKDEWWDGEGRSHFNWDYFFTIKILPGLLNDKESKFKIDFKVVRPHGIFQSDETVFSGKLQLPDSKTHVHREKGDNGPITMLIRRFSKSDFLLEGDIQNQTFTYKYSAQLDLKGNGAELIPDSPVTGDGTFETQAFDIK